MLIFVSDDDWPCMVFEYMEYGDLTEFLRRNDPFLGFKTTIDLKQVLMLKRKLTLGFWYSVISMELINT